MMCKEIEIFFHFDKSTYPIEKFSDLLDRLKTAESTIYEFDIRTYSVSDFKEVLELAASKGIAWFSGNLIIPDEFIKKYIDEQNYSYKSVTLGLCYGVTRKQEWTIYCVWSEERERKQNDN